MTFDTIIGILLSILLPKVFENIASENHNRISVITLIPKESIRLKNYQMLLKILRVRSVIMI
jgi:hypothetical protein